MPFGKIDNLPAAIRADLNARLDDGQPGSEILPWLNGLPEVKTELARRWNAAPITDQNLSNWRLGGYKVHCERREKSARTRELADYSRSLGLNSADILSGGAAIAGGMILETLEQLDSTQQTALLIEKPENLPAFLNAMARLQAVEGQKQDRAIRKARVEITREALALATERHRAQTTEALLNKATSVEVQKIVNSSQPKKVKLAQLRLALYGPETPNQPAPKILE